MICQDIQCRKARHLQDLQCQRPVHGKEINHLHTIALGYCEPEYAHLKAYSTDISGGHTNPQKARP